MKPLYIILLFVLVLLTGCIRDEVTATDPEAPVFITLQLEAANTSINEDKVLGEDRVSEVRMIVFKLNGEVVYNDMLVFPAGIENKCAAVGLKPNIYNFYFFANESVNPAIAAALVSVTSLAQMQQDARFKQLAYNPDFYPDLTTSGGRFLMSAIYNNIRISQGGTEDEPLPLPLPTGTVEMVRALSKVEIVFKKKTPGASITGSNQIASVGLLNVAGVTDIPPADAYYTASAPVSSSPVLTPASGLGELNYGRDSIGAGVFYVPEFLNSPGNAARYTQLVINNRTFPVLTDKGRLGLLAQRRDVALSDSSIIRNYHYQIVANISQQGGIFLQTDVVPWRTSKYSYMFQDENTGIDLPPVEATTPGVIVPVPCEGGQRVEIRYSDEKLGSGLMGAFGDQISYYDSRVGGPLITNPNGFVNTKTSYCESRYGKGWRFINSCELMAFFSMFDQAHRVFESNSWQGRGSQLPFYTKVFRQQAADLLAQLSGVDVTAYKNSMVNDNQVTVGANGVSSGTADGFGSTKFNMIDNFYTPGDVVVTVKDNPYPNYPAPYNAWPYPGPIATAQNAGVTPPPPTYWWYPAPPENGIAVWYPMELQHQLKGYWYPNYLRYDDPANYNKILYTQFVMYSHSSTVSRCVRVVE